MILRAQISKVIDKYHYRVRIPQFNKHREALGATPESELYVATAAVEAGISPILNVNDTVLVAFENGNEDSPSIIGLLFNDKAMKSKSDAAFTSLDVSVNAKFSSDVTIGAVTKDNIKHLEKLNTNVQTKFEDIDRNIDAAKSAIQALVTTTVELRTDVDINSQNIKGLNNDLNDVKDNIRTHNNDTTKHITAAERTAWNGKANAEHTHTTLVVSNASYGTGDPPASAVEGQLYFKIS